MRVILAGGGTAGHINPALAIGLYIKEKLPDTELLYVGCSGKMEEKLAKKAGINFKGITVSGFSRKISLSSLKNNIITVKRAIGAQIASKKIIKEFKPDLCIGTGGYVSGPVVKAAAKLKVKTVIHEQNAFPGVTTKLLCPHVDRVMLAFEDAKKHIKSKPQFVLTGNPVREEILKANKNEARKALNLTDEKPVILSFGGSLGARPLNEAVSKLIARSAKDKKYHHIHATGKSGYDSFLKLLADEGINDISKYDNLDIREYIYDMPQCMAASDLVISRAGAISISEIEAMGKASILIPSPYVAENHQYHNAMTLVNANAAAVIEEKDLTAQKLMENADKMLSSRDTIEYYGNNAKKQAVLDANERIFRVIKDVMGL